MVAAEERQCPICWKTYRRWSWTQQRWQRWHPAISNIVVWGRAGHVGPCASREVYECFLVMKNNPACEQWSKQDWKRNCRMLKHPENKISIVDITMIASLRLTLFKHQMIAMFWMLFHKRGDCEGRTGWDLEKYVPTRSSL